MDYLVYILSGLCGGILIGMSGLTAAMVLTPILSKACGWAGYDAVTMSLIANVPSALVSSATYYRNGNADLKAGSPVALCAFLGTILGSYLGFLFSRVSDGGISYLVIAGNFLMAAKFFLPQKSKAELRNADRRSRKNRFALAISLSFLIGTECGFMGSAGGVMMLMVLTLVLGMSAKQAIGTGSIVMSLVAVTGAVSHIIMGASIDLLPGAVITLSCTIGAVVSSRFANKVSDKTMNRCAGAALILISVVSLLIS